MLRRHLERGDDAHRPVVLPAVPVRVAVRPDPMAARRAQLRATSVPRVLRDGEAELLQRRREVVERRRYSVVYA